MEKLKMLKQEYQETPIPEELDFMVRSTIQQHKKAAKNRKNMVRWGSSVAAVLALVISINVNPSIAHAMSKIPVVGQIVKVLTFKTYSMEEDTYFADIEVPAIEGLKNEDLQKTLNERYLKENQELYDTFMKDIKEVEAMGGAHMGVASGYEVKTDNDMILSIGRYVVNIAGSGTETIHYDTVDKVNGLMITLPSLFKDDAYIEIISQNIIEQMKAKMLEDSANMYWVEEEEFIEPFKCIKADQSFYITNAGKLMISFDEYEVAPGCMGVVEFEIPTDILKDVLVSDLYIH